MSVLMVANWRDKKANSLFSTRRSFNFLPEILSIFSYTDSKSPYSLINLRAVFSPTPGTPGILSEESPISAFISITLSGP